MATFIGLIRLTDQGRRHVKETTQRAEEFDSFVQQIDSSLNAVYWAIEKHEVTVKDIYWSQGLYDGIIILDAPDAETAMSVFLRLDSLGNVRTHSFQAFSKQEMARIVAKLE
ncbi:MAG: GYD domain-containing protein [Gammaproteobacteria bacterium]